jgi:hypothetical protein
MHTIKTYYIFSIFLFLYSCSSISVPELQILDTGKTDDKDVNIFEESELPEDNVDNETEDYLSDGFPVEDVDETDISFDSDQIEISSCIEGKPCDDLDPCTFQDKCSGNICSGTLYACDDKRECTDDSCDGNGACIFVLMDEYCLVNGLCLEDGDEDSYNTCNYCNSKISQFSFSVKNDTDPCNDGNPCTVSGTCQNGLCIEKDADCNDNNFCTDDFCDEIKGCVNDPKSVKCDDGNECTSEDFCENGICKGYPIDCDDGNPCTEDICFSDTGCEYMSFLKDGEDCDDDSICSSDSICEGGKCISTGTVLNCNDGNICTEDGCDAYSGCYHDFAVNPCCSDGVSVCDDGNVCTDDGCNPSDFECIYSDNTASCSDSDACTENDTCGKGECKGSPVDCNDQNECTSEVCDKKAGCIYTPLDQTPCDDGLECTADDHCENGKCVADSSQCVCKPFFYSTVNKVNSLQVGKNGKEGEGLNIDNDLNTCSPQGDCEKGIDNNLGPTGALGNDSINKSLEKGDLTVLFEHRGIKFDGSSYTMAIYTGKLDPANSTCNFQTSNCAYLIENKAMDKDCNPMVSFDNTKIAGNKLTAGGKQYFFPFQLSLPGGITIEVNLYNATINASVTISGNTVTEMTGIIGGAVPKQQLLDGINAIPDSQISPPFTKESLLQLIDGMIVNDIEIDGTEPKDAASIGLKFSAIQGTITGVKK